MRKNTPKAKALKHKKGRERAKSKAIAKSAKSSATKSEGDNEVEDVSENDPDIEGTEALLQ